MSTSFHAQGPVTFGVEIETILAFDQSCLQSVLDRYYTAKILKSFPDQAHATFLLEETESHTCRSLYPSWALQVPSDPEQDPSLQVVAQQSTTIIGLPGKIRRYLAEPLIIAKEAIGETTSPIDIQATLRRGAQPLSLNTSNLETPVVLRARSANYKHWTLTTDHSLIGCIEEQLHNTLEEKLYKHNTITDPDGPIRSSRTKQWDSSGIEIISPIFNYSDKTTAYSSINQILHRLQGPSHQTITSPWASLQVHVGFDCNDSQMIPLQTIKHLAYVLLCHEDLLSKLHPRSRCGLALRKKVTEEPQEPCFEDFDSDFDDIDLEFSTNEKEKTPAEIAAEDEQYLRENNKRVLATEAAYTGFGTTSSNARYFSHITQNVFPPTSDAIASHIFHPKIALPQLISLLQKPSLSSGDAEKGHRFRGYMYNFDNLLSMYLQDDNVWKTGKPTIEFRQHACSNDPEEIRQWVELCFKITQFAQRMAAQGTATEYMEEIIFPQLQEARKYSAGGQWPCTTIEQLLGQDNVGLDGEDVKFWVDRYERYKEDRPTDEEIDSTIF